MRIGIGDAKAAEREAIREICCTVAEAEGAEAEILMFSSGAEVLEYPSELDILILETEKTALDGIAIQEYTEKKGSRVRILFLTNRLSLQLEGYGKHFVAFLEKSGLEEKLAGLLRLEVQRGLGNVCLENGVNSREILYVQAAGNYMELHLERGKVALLRTSMDALEKKLRHVDFIKIHRGILINLRQVKAVTEKESIMRNGVRLEISVRRRKEIKDRFKAYREAR